MNNKPDECDTEECPKSELINFFRVRVLEGEILTPDSYLNQITQI